jgi:hypothetical protein
VDTIRTVVGLMAALLVLTGVAASSFASAPDHDHLPEHEAFALVGGSLSVPGLVAAAPALTPISQANHGPTARMFAGRSTRTVLAFVTAPRLLAAAAVHRSIERDVLDFALREALLRSGRPTRGTLAPPYPIPL